MNICNDIRNRDVLHNNVVIIGLVDTTEYPDASSWPVYVPNVPASYQSFIIKLDSIQLNLQMLNKALRY